MAGWLAYEVLDSADGPGPHLEGILIEEGIFKVYHLRILSPVRPILGRLGVCGRRDCP